MATRRVGLIGDYNPEVPAHRAIPPALHLAAERVGAAVEPVWVPTATLTGDVPRRLADYAGLWCVPASPYANTDGSLTAIRVARDSGRPLLGTCGGFQHALLEYARHVLGLAEADHTEIHPDAALPLMAPLACSLVEQTGPI